MEAAMPDYIMLYRNTADARREAMGSPERAQQSMQKWRAWMKEMTDQGHLKNVGQPMDDPGRVVRKKAVTDGPYIETKDIVGGFSIIEAPDLDHAARIAGGCPVLEGGGSVEVRPIRKMDL
jgi:hypothetical protein